MNLEIKSASASVLGQCFSQCLYYVAILAAKAALTENKLLYPGHPEYLLVNFALISHSVPRVVTVAHS